MGSASSALGWIFGGSIADLRRTCQAVLAVQVKEKDLVCLRPGGHEISVTEGDQLAALRTDNSIRIADYAMRLSRNPMSSLPSWRISPSYERPA